MTEAKKIELARLREEIALTHKRLANLKAREAEIDAAIAAAPRVDRPRTLYAE